MVCRYNEQLDLYYWDPVDPPDGEEVDLSYTGLIRGSDYHFVVSRTEWIRGRLKTGSDTYVRRPARSPLFLNAGQIGVFSRLWKWSGSSWNQCRDSGWSYTTFRTESRVPTFDWGSGPCGSGYYGNHAYGAHLSNGSWLVSGPMWSGYLFASAGSSASASGQEVEEQEKSASPPNRVPSVRKLPPLPLPGTRGPSAQAIPGLVPDPISLSLLPSYVGS